MSRVSQDNLPSNQRKKKLCSQTESRDLRAQGLQNIIVELVIFLNRIPCKIKKQTNKTGN